MRFRHLGPQKMVAFDISLLKCKKNPVEPRFQANPVMEISDSYWLSGWTALFPSEDSHELNHIVRKNENKILCIQIGSDAVLWLAGLCAELRKSALSHLGKAIKSTVRTNAVTLKKKSES